MQFRAALYEWKHEPPPPPLEGVGKEMGGDGDAGSRVMDVQAEAVEDPSECIPLQLQRLFGQLQLSDRSCVETRALTNSFGWTTQVSKTANDAFSVSVALRVLCLLFCSRGAIGVDVEEREGSYFHLDRCIGKTESGIGRWVTMSFSMWRTARPLI